MSTATQNRRALVARFGVLLALGALGLATPRPARADQVITQVAINAPRAKVWAARRWSRARCFAA
ncbi:MAG TPA: hypothetical protein VHY32_02250 [Caulobacteraceae bacterium]|jgi:hypothetical protein|nr:hypothetical protein [Caulobacteraceae bacterium]